MATLQRPSLNQNLVYFLQQRLGLVTWPEEEQCVREEKIQLHEVAVLIIQVFPAVSSGGKKLFFLMSVTIEGPSTELG